MNFRKKFEDKPWVQYTIAACLAVLLYVCLIKINVIFAGIGQFFELLSPVISGIVLAYLINPLVTHLEKHLFHGIPNDKVRRMCANLTSFVFVILIAILILSFLIPQLIDSVLLFVSNLNIYAETAQQIIDDIVARGEHLNLDMSIMDRLSSNVLERFVTMITENTGKIARGSLHIGNNTFNLLLGLILAVYFLGAKHMIIETYHRVLRCILSKYRYQKVTGFLAECNQILSTYVVSDIIDAIIVGIINAVFMMIMGMPYGVMVSVVVAVTNLLPTFGPFIGAFIGALILLFANPMSAVIFLIFTLILQLIDGYIIKPRLFGKALGVPGVWVTLGIIAGGKLFGFIGVALSVPVVGIIHLVLSDLIRQKEAKMEQESQWKQEH